MSKFKKHYVEQKKQGPKEYLLYDYISIKFQNPHN